MTDRLRLAYLPHELHPVAWWVWAIGLAVAASRTTNPLLLTVIVAVAAVVVALRRGQQPWARAFRLYLLLGALIIVIRVGFRIVLGGGEGPTVLVQLPRIPLPGWAGDSHLLGPVSAESLLTGLYDGMRLAAIVICVGAANTLANPRRLLRCLPSSLYEIATVLVVATSVFPQLAESVVRVSRARRLRAGAPRATGRVRRFFAALRQTGAIIVPVLADALDRSLALATSMDVRGHGRHGTRLSRAASVRANALTVTGLILIAFGLFRVLDTGLPDWIGPACLLGGCAAAVGGFGVAARRLRTTRYRPEHWDLPAVGVVVCGLVPAVVLLLVPALDAADVAAYFPDTSIAAWPVLPLLGLGGCLIGVLAAAVSPPQVDPRGSAASGVAR